MTPKRVALLIETSTSWGSQIIAGISDYVRRHERWLLYIDHRGVFEQQTLPSWWEGDGVIARLTSPLLAQQVRHAACPCVNVSQIRVPGVDVQHVTTNETTVGELAAQSLLGAGLRHFAYYGPPKREHYTDRVAVAYQQVLARAGARVAVFDPDRILRSDTNPHLNLPELVQWLQSLPRPCGVLAWNSLGAHRIAEACCLASIRVPEDISILAGDHDHLLAEIATPRLTCIDHAPRRVGYIAASELARIMSGGQTREPVLVEPEGVVSRGSVIHGVIEDELVAEAVRFIEANVHRPIGIEEILEHVPTSRRSLELHFRRALGRGPAAELRRIRLREARRLLAETELPIKRIALECGFATPEHLQRLLRAETSLTPTQYREAHRRRPNEGTSPPTLAPLDSAVDVWVAPQARRPSATARGEAIEPSAD